MSAINVNPALLSVQSTQNPIRRAAADPSTFRAAVARVGDGANPRAQIRIQGRGAGGGEAAANPRDDASGGAPAFRSAARGAEPRRPLAPGSLINIVV